ncbi:MAG: hypothetical protein P4L40_22645 [Terracidiphilus sp.]|nr:hypothetical protein [Terracidiphilus sp.]
MRACVRACVCVCVCVYVCECVCMIGHSELLSSRLGGEGLPLLLPMSLPLHGEQCPRDGVPPTLATVTHTTHTLQTDQQQPLAVCV